MINLKSPDKSDIIIFDECNSEYLKKIIIDDYSINVIKQRPHDYFVSYSIIRLFLGFLSKFSLENSLNHPRGLVFGLLNQLRLIYYYSLISYIKPKAVITFIDNNQIFNQLSKNLIEFPFIAIQNGLRLISDRTENYHVQHLFCYGLNEMNYFKNIGYEVENFYPSGSLISSLHTDKNMIKSQSKYDILIISCWRGNIGYGPDVIDTMNAMKIMDSFLSKFIRKNNLKAAVIMRNERDGPHWFMPEIGKNEENYFKDIYSNNIDIIDVDFKKRNVYELGLESSVIVSLLSSVLIELYGFRKKILYYNFCNTKDYHLLFNKLILSNSNDWNSFSNELDELLKIDYKEYYNIHKKNMKFYMSYPSDFFTYKFISKKITQIINNKT